MTLHATTILADTIATIMEILGNDVDRICGKRTAIGLVFAVMN